MRNIFLFSMLLIFFNSCSKSNNEYAESGTLTGLDLKMNACSGGLYLQTSNKLYHIEELPGLNSQELYNLSFPVTIYFNGSATGKCVGMADDGYFKITSYKF